jgi:endoglucanase
MPRFAVTAFGAFGLWSVAGCLTPPGMRPSVATSPAQPGAALATTAPPPFEKMTEVDAWDAVAQMSPGINIGNTLENTTVWETGWGNPPITQPYVVSLAKLGFKTVRLPVAWDTYAVDGQIQPDKMGRVREVVDWITGAGMFCVLNIHWDGGWIDADVKDKFPRPFTFRAEAEQKYRSYWQQIATFFAGKNEKLILESLNEETNFQGEGSIDKAYATLQRVNQLFIDTVRLLIIAGYSTDFEKTSAPGYKLPTDTLPGRLFVSVHYYTPYPFAGLTEDADWGKMMPTWGTPSDVEQLRRLFDEMSAFCVRNDLPAFVGEFNVTEKKESASRVRWMTAVSNAATARRMVPVLWDTGHDVSRAPPFAPSPELVQMLRQLQPPPPGRPRPPAQASQ